MRVVTSPDSDGGSGGLRVQSGSPRSRGDEVTDGSHFE